MYYFDIINISKIANGYIFSEILSGLHIDKYNTGEFAIDFPNYRIGEEDMYLKKHSSQNPQVGTVLRIFTQQKEVANRIISLKVLNDNVKKNLINISNVSETPKTSKYVVWIKNLTKDHINKKLKELKKNNFTNITKETLLSQIQTLRDKEESEEVKLIYLKIKSNSNNNVFSLFLERVITEEQNFENFKTTSYGVSFKDNLIALPLF